jgi:hypothetical protein
MLPQPRRELQRQSRDEGNRSATPNALPPRSVENLLRNHRYMDMQALKRRIISSCLALNAIGEIDGNTAFERARSCTYERRLPPVLLCVA